MPRRCEMKSADQRAGDGAGQDAGTEARPEPGGEMQLA